MLFLSISDLYFSHKQKPIFAKINLKINQPKKVALIGANGSGKTTLLNLIYGKLAPDTGSIKTCRSLESLEQDLNNEQLKLSIMDFISEKIGDSQPWVVDYALNLARMEQIGPEQKMISLSGGQKTRLGFASLLANIRLFGDEKSTLLLLDEPTNNLDRWGTEWLISILNDFKGSIIFSSHERFLIDKIAGSIYLIENNDIEEFNCGYNEMKNILSIRRRHQEDEYLKKSKEAQKISSLIKAKKRQISKASNLKFDSKKSGVSKMSFNNKKNSVQRAEGKVVSSLNTKLNSLGDINKPTSEPVIDIQFPNSAQPNSKIIIEMKNITKSFDNLVALKNINLSLTGNEKILVSGNNGSGKTTLLKIITGLIQPDFGTCKLGEGIKPGYFAQDIYNLNLEHKVLEELVDSGCDVSELVRLLIKAGIPLESTRAVAKDLSRGQQAKLGFMKLITEKPNLLILDEPTNHLDIETKEVIEKAILNFEGPMIIVSHDKYLTNKLKLNKEIKL
jgi:macrolide transport system ATP-binding/permease protein